MSITTVVVLLASLCLLERDRLSLVLLIPETVKSFNSLQISQSLVYMVPTDLYLQIQSALSDGIWPVTVRQLVMNQLKWRKVLKKQMKLLSIQMNRLKKVRKRRFTIVSWETMSFQALRIMMTLIYNSLLPLSTSLTRPPVVQSLHLDQVKSVNSHRTQMNRR